MSTALATDDEEEAVNTAAIDSRIGLELSLRSLKVPNISPDKTFTSSKFSLKMMQPPRDSITSFIQRQADHMFQAADSRFTRKVFKSDDALTNEQRRQFEVNRFIIHPFSKFRWYWDLVMVVTLICCLLYLPFNIAFFTDDLEDHWLAINVIFDIVFIIDIALNFRTGCIHPATEEVILSTNEIAIRYLKTWFVLDFLSSVPFDYLYAAFSGNNRSAALITLRVMRLTKLLSLLRIFRMARLLRYVHKLEEILEIEGKIIRIINLVLLILVLSHWNGCLQYLIAFLDDFPSDSWVVRNSLHYQNVTMWDRYTLSVFRAMSHMLCIGYGRVKPFNNTETWSVIFSMMLGATFYALFIAHINTLLMTIDGSGRLYEEKLSQVQEYMKYRRVPFKLQKRVLEYYDHKYQRKFFDERAILHPPNLSHSLRQEILMHNCKGLVEKVPFLANAPEDFLCDIISKLRFEVFFPGEYVIHAGKRGDSMYFIEHGKVKIIVDGQVVNKLGDGSHFGEISLLLDERRVASVLAVETCDVFTLTRQDFDEVLEEYPHMRRVMGRVARQRLLSIAQQIKHDGSTRHYQRGLQKLEERIDEEEQGEPPPPPSLIPHISQIPPSPTLPSHTQPSLSASPPEHRQSASPTSSGEHEEVMMDSGEPEKSPACASLPGPLPPIRGTVPLQTSPRQEETLPDVGI